MATVSITLPSDGTTADVADYNTPLTTLANAINGNLDNNNISSVSGTKVTSGTLNASSFDATTAKGYIALSAAPNTVTYNGNRSYSLVFNSTDLTGTLSAGMRLRTTRTVAAPTQCTSLNGSTQYYSKTSPAGMTFTNNFVVSAHIPAMTSYPAVAGWIASRYNGTSGWGLTITSTGQVRLIGFNAGAANFSYVISYQSIPLNKKVHVAAQLDMATFTASPTTSYVMIDGVDVPASVTRGGTNPTALVQPAADLQIGAANSTEFFPGKLAQVAIYSAKVTQATILASISQGLAGTETSLVSAYSFNNSVNDLNANANNLTANGSAVATTADSPFGGQADGTISSTLDYGIITKTAFSTNTTVTVQVPEGCTIPTSGGVSGVVYSSVKVPFGFPGETKFSLNAYDTSGTLTNPLLVVMAQFVTNKPMDGLPYSNSGTSGGMMYLYVIGSEKRISGIGSTITASTGGTNFTFNLPTSFFTTYTSISATPTFIAVDGRQYCTVDNSTTTNILNVVAVTTGAGGTQKQSILAIGT